MPEPQQHQSVPEGWDVIAMNGATTSNVSPVSPGHWEDKGIAGAVWHPDQGPTNERHRPDNSVLGMPPELAVVGGVGVARAAAAGGAGLIAKTAAGLKNAGQQALPVAKAAAAYKALTAIGVPAHYAAAAVAALSLAHGGKGAATTETAVAPEMVAAESAAPAASAPVAPAPPVAPAGTGTSTATGLLSPQRIQNELGIAARRAGIKLTEPQYSAAADLVGKGATPSQAVQAAQSLAKTADPAAALAAKLGTPDTESVIRAVVDRNVTGRWR